MKIFVRIMGMFMMCVLFVATAMAADSALTIANPSVLDWFRLNIVAVLTVLLALSELFALMPWFKGNGILDAIVKILKLMLEKRSSSVGQ